MDKVKMLEFQKRTVEIMKGNILHHQMLYRLTKHSKKKAKHLAGIKFHKDVLLLAYGEYGWDISEAKDYIKSVNER